MLLSATAIGAVTEVLDAVGLLPRVARRRSTAPRSRSTARASRSTRSRSRTSSTSAASSSASAAREDRRARGGRAGDLERRALRADRQGDGDAARPRPRRPGDPAARPRPARARRPISSTAPSRWCSTSRSSGSPATSPHIHDLLNESFARIMHLYEAGVDVTGIPSGFRELDKLTSGFQPGNLVILAARPSMGKSALAPLHGRQPRRAPRDAGRAVHARDVEGRGDPAPDVQRGEGRVAAPALGPARAGRLAAAHRRLRQADEGADLRRRHRLDHDDGAPLEGAAPQVARAEARDDHRRLPPADDLRLEPSRTACRRSRRSRAR